MYERDANIGLETLIPLLKEHKDVALLFSMEFSEWMRKGVENDIRERGFPLGTVKRDSINNKRMIISIGHKSVKSNEDALSYLNSGEAF